MTKGYSDLNCPDFQASAFFQEIGELQEQEEMDSITMMHMNSDVKIPKKQTSSTSQRKGSSNQQTYDYQKRNRLQRLSRSAKKIDQNEEQKQIFVTTFKPEDCGTLKHKLAQKEPVTDPYVPPSTHQFREEKPQTAGVEFKTRLKCEPLNNPHLMSEHDQRPQFVIEREQMEKAKKELKEKLERDTYLGLFVQQKDWVCGQLKYFPLADRNHNFVDHKRPEFLATGPYQEPSHILSSLLRGETDFQHPFKLFHRLLRCDDHNLFMGQVKDSKY